jgi:alpha,alpha-trehalose phosphorylase
MAAVSAFGGLRDPGEELLFFPRLPGALARLRYKVTSRGRKLTVEVTPSAATYTLREGDPIEIVHHGTKVKLAPGKAHECPIPKPPALDPPVQPPGRAPARRRPLR